MGIRDVTWLVTTEKTELVKSEREIFRFQVLVRSAFPTKPFKRHILQSATPVSVATKELR
jgi:hypothetical protein